MEGLAIIDEMDLFKYHHMPTTYDWGLMCELKDKGAPITGVFNPKPDLENYDWKMTSIFEGTRRIFEYRWVYRR